MCQESFKAWGIEQVPSTTSCPHDSDSGCSGDQSWSNLEGIQGEVTLELACAGWKSKI